MLDTLRQVQVFLTTHAAVIGPVIAALRHTLDDVVSQLASYATAQEGGKINSRGETAKQRVLRRALRKTHMRPVAEVAKQKLRDVPEFHAFVMPPSKATSTQLVAHALAMAEAATKHEQVFRAIGLPEDFIARLRAAADEVTRSIDDRKQHAGKRSGATAGLAAEESRGRSVLKLIDALVVPLLGSDDALVREWQSAKRVPKKPGPVATAIAYTSNVGAPVATHGNAVPVTQPAGEP
jgi:hypothetical protein